MNASAITVEWEINNGPCVTDRGIKPSQEVVESIENIM